MPNYPEYDQNVAIYYSNEMTKSVGGVDSRGQFAKPDEVKRFVDVQAVPGHSQEQMAVIESMFHNKVGEYMGDTMNMVLLNDLANTNKFANMTTDNENTRLVKLRQRTTSELMKKKSEYLQYKYAIDYQKFLIVIVQMTFFVTILCAMLFYAFQLGKINVWVLGTIAGIIMSIYLFILILLWRNMYSRRKDDWNKFYFFSTKSM